MSKSRLQGMAIGGAGFVAGVLLHQSRWVANEHLLALVVCVGLVPVIAFYWIKR